MTGKILREYVSEVDQFLKTFDKEHIALSASQQEEIEKYQRIYFLRDNEDQPPVQKAIWEGF